jgi:glutamyl-tRNA synthetase
LGWHPSSDKEIFDKTELVEAFELERVSKSGARFDFEKACWFNQQYIMKMSNAELATKMRPYVDKADFEETVCDEYLESVAALMKERVVFVKEFVSKGYYFFKLPDYALMMEQEGKDFEKKVLSNWNADRKILLENLVYKIENLETCSAQNLQTNVESFIAENGLKFGDVLPVLRLALSGTMKGPGVFEMMELIGKEYVKVRLLNFFDFCNAMAIKE